MWVAVPGRRAGADRGERRRQRGGEGARRAGPGAVHAGDVPPQFPLRARPSARRRGRRVVGPAGRRVPVLTGADQVAFLDLDDTVKATYGYAKQGAGRGYTGINGLNALLATVCTPLSAPLMAATRLRKGSTNSVRGAAKLLADALACARAAGGGGLLIVRADSAYYYCRDIIAAARRAGARFSVTARQTPAVITAVAGI